MDISSLISSILKKVVPDLIGTAGSLFVTYWLLQAVSADAGLMHIIRIATAIFIVAYLAIILVGTSLQVIDEHKWRIIYIEQIRLGNVSPQIVDADPPRRLVGSKSFNSSSSYLPYRHKNFLPLFRIVTIIVVVCVLGGILLYFHIIDVTITSPGGIRSDPSIVTTNPWSNWQTIPNKCYVVGGTYHVSTPTGQDLNACYGPEKQFKNFTYEAEMTILKGHCGGLLFRKVNNVNKYYVFQVCQDRTYALLKYTDNAGKVFRPFFGVSKDNRAINPGLGAMNTIAVTATGDAFTLFINRSPVAIIHDNSYSEGVIALVASSDLSYVATKVAYQKVNVTVN